MFVAVRRLCVTERRYQRQGTECECIELIRADRDERAPSVMHSVRCRWGADENRIELGLRAFRVRRTTKRHVAKAFC